MLELPHEHLWQYCSYGNNMCQVTCNYDNVAIMCKYICFSYIHIASSVWLRVWKNWTIFVGRGLLDLWIDSRYSQDKWTPDSQATLKTANTFSGVSPQLHCAYIVTIMSSNGFRVKSGTVALLLGYPTGNNKSSFSFTGRWSKTRRRGPQFNGVVVTVTRPTF